MRGYYLCQMEISNAGPTRKISGQVDIFNSVGLCTELINEIIPPNTIVKKISKRLPYTSVDGIFLYRDKFRDADFFYIRFSSGDYQFTKFLRKLQKRHPCAKIIVEFSNFPYDNWMKNIISFPVYLKELNARRKYKKLVDRFAILSDIPEIYGVKTLVFTNGIIVDKVKKKNIVPSLNTVSIIAVAGMCYFHGYERMIEGIHNYYQDGGKREVLFYLVGGEVGDQIPFYKKLVQKYLLEDHVKFCGDLLNKDLDVVYNGASIGVSGLGIYKTEFTSVSSLKVREYLARGLPVIYASEEDILVQNENDFSLKFPNDESPIDIEKVIEFHDNLYLNSGKSQEEIINEIRDFAYRTCDMSVAMKPIIDYIKSDER